MSNTDDPGAGGTGRRGRTTTTGGATGTPGARGRTGGARGAGATTPAAGTPVGGAGSTPMPPTGAAPSTGTGASTPVGGATGSTGSGATGGAASGSGTGATGATGGASTKSTGTTGAGALGGGASTTASTGATPRTASPTLASPTGVATMSSLRAGGGGHFHYSLISWGSVFAGALIAIVVGAMLNVLGVAFGITAAEPGDPSGPGAGTLTVFGGLWIAISTVIGLLVGGYVAARAAANPDHHDGALHGAAVWAVSFVVALFLTGSFVSGTAMSTIQAAGNAADEARAPAARAVDAARGAAGALRDEGERDAATERRAEEAADRAADAASAAAWWAFITMAASLLAAMIGGGFGARSDHGHRPRRTYSDMI